MIPTSESASLPNLEDLPTARAAPAMSDSAPAATVHIAVMEAEVMEGLRPAPGGVFVDGTLGGAGHTSLLLARVAPGGRVLAIDADPEPLARAGNLLAAEVAAGRLLLRHANFARLGALARAAGIAPVDGVLLDLGLSSDQLAARDRGFSFTSDGALDMRFDPTTGESAADLVNTLEADALADIFWRYGEERLSRPIARRIVEARTRAPITRAGELARLVAGVVHGRPGGVHPATRVFQALRIAVNDELASLEAALPEAVAITRPGGRIAIISFHSLEDRIVKRYFQQEERGCVCPPDIPACVCGRTPTLRIITKHPLTAGPDELATNPRARSAKLRIAERI